HRGYFLFPPNPFTLDGKCYHRRTHLLTPQYLNRRRGCEWTNASALRPSIGFRLDQTGLLSQFAIRLYPGTTGRRGSNPLWLVVCSTGVGLIQCRGSSAEYPSDASSHSHR